MLLLFETDERIELRRALELAREQAALVRDDPYRWKWVLIGVHNAVQAAIVCAVSGSDKLGALTPKSRSEWLKEYRAGTYNFPVERLEHFMPLYGEMKRKTGFVASAETDNKVGKLNALRNDFTHFRPIHWTYDVSLFIEVIEAGLPIVDHVAWDPEWVLWMDHTSREGTKSEYDRLVADLGKLKADFDEAVVAL